MNELEAVVMEPAQMQGMQGWGCSSVGGGLLCINRAEMLENQTHREGKKPDELEMVAQACDSRTWEAEVGNGGRRLRSSSQGHL